MELLLTRNYFPKGTNGELFLNGRRVCSTIELPGRKNKPQASCIPEGKYLLKARCNKRFGKHFILCGVPNRSLILIHPANNALTELKGCIAPVMTVIGEGKGMQSRQALAALVAAVEWSQTFARNVAAIEPRLSRPQTIFLNIQSSGL